MKIIKTIIGLFALLAILVFAMLIYVMSSSFQTAQVNKMLAESLPNSNVGNVSIGFGALALNDVNVKLANGDVFKANSLVAKYRLSALFSRKIDISDVNLQGAKFIMAKRPETAEGAPSQTKSSATELEKPVDTKAGQAVGAEKKPLDIGFQICLAKAELNFELESPDGSKILTTTQISSVEVAPNLLPLSAMITSKIAASVPQRNPENFEIEATLTPDGEKMSLKVMLKHGKSKIIQAAAKLAPDYRSADFELRADLSNGQLEPLVGSLMKLPTFTSSFYAAGKFENAAENAQAKIIFKNSVSDLKNVAATLDFLGKCGLDGELEVQKKSSVISVSKLDVSLTESSDTILALSSPNAFSIDVNNLSKLPEGDLAVLSFALPVRYAAAFAKDYKIDASDVCGKISISRGADNSLSAKTISPITLASFNVTKGDEALLKDFNANLNIEASTNLKGKFDASAKIDIADSAQETLSISAQAKIDNADIDAKAEIKGSLNPVINRVNSISSFASNNLKIESTLSAAYNGKTATLKSLKLELFDAQNKSVASISDGGAIGYNLEKKSLECPSKVLLKISAPNFPFALIKPFAADADLEKLSIESQIDMASADKFDVVATVSAKSLSYKSDNEFILRRLSPSIAAKISYDIKKNAVNANVERLVLNDGSADFAIAKADLNYDIAAKKIGNCAINANISLPALLSQPVLMKFANVSTGSIEIESKLSATSCDAQVRVNNLTAKGASSEKFDTAVIKAIAKFESDFSKIDADISIAGNSTNGETKANATVKNTKTETRLNIDIKSAVVEDASILASAFSNKSYEADKAVMDAKSQGKVAVVRPKSLEAIAPESNVISDKKDAKAFWDIGRSIYVDAKIAKLMKDGKAVLENFETSAICEPKKLSLSKLKGTVYGAATTGSAHIDFDASRTNAYALDNTKLDLQNMEVSKVFSDPSKAMITGEFSANLNLKGNGNNMEHLLAYISGNAKVVGTGGKLTLIDTTTQTGAMTSLAGSAMKIAGAFLKNKAYEVGAMGDIIGYFEKLNYTSAKIEAARDAKTLNITLSTAEIKTEALILDASGGVINLQPSVPIKEQPLYIPVGIKVADGSVRKMFQKLRYGEKQSTEKGYYNGPSFEIGGTIGAPKTNLLSALMTAQSTAEKEAAKQAVSAASKDSSEAAKESAVAKKVTTETPPPQKKEEIKDATSAVRGLLNSFKKKN